MLTRAQKKYMRSFAQKKVRDAEGAFIAEGPKAVGELAENFPCRLLVGTADYFAAHADLVAGAAEAVEVSAKDLGEASLLQCAHDVIAIFDKERLPHPAPATGSLMLALDGVQDPGNVGTIVRTADWFGISRIYCSPDCADAFAPKVVQATMGALGRVEIEYTPLPELLDGLSPDVPTYGTFLDGDNIYHVPLAAGGLLVLGSEGRGISTEVEQRLRHRLYIPPFPPHGSCVESLNVAMAAAIACAEFRRRTF